MHEFSLHVKKWSAWAPGIDRCDSWAHWSYELARESESEGPDVSFIKPMVRRRLSKVSRLALYAVNQCQSGGDVEQTIESGIFCSRHGESVRTLSIYNSIADSGTVSPTQFSQSVHSAAAGMFSIENQLTIPFTAIAAGAASAELGFIEAWTQLATGRSEVLLVMADEHLGEPFNKSATAPEFSFGVAMLLGHFVDSPRITLAKTAEKSPILGGTDNLLATLTGQGGLRLQGDNGWKWRWNEQ